MAIRQKTPICPICKEGHVTRRMEEYGVSAMERSGNSVLSVAMLIGNCDNCHAKSLDPRYEKILGQAFQRSYARQAGLKDKN